VLLFIGLVLINYLASQIPWRVDSTAEKIYTLSPGTHSLLGKIEEPITLDFYFSSGASGLPISFKNYGTRVEEMLRQYARASRGRLVLNVISPEPDTPEEEAATRAGLQPQLIPTTGEQIYFGLSATQADMQETIATFTPSREQFLEYDLSQLIYTVQVLEKRRMGLISSLPLLAPPFNPMMAQMGQQPPPDQFIIGEWERTFEIETIDATATELPDNLDVLVVVHPQGMSPELEYEIDQYLLAGNPVMLAVDPSSEFFKRQSNPQQQMMGATQPNVSSDLPTLLSAYDIVYSTNAVTGDLLYGAQVNTGMGGVSRFPHWLSLPAESFNAEIMPTAQLNSMVLVESGQLALASGSNLTFTPLIKTSDQAGNIPPMLLQYTRPEQLAGQIDPSGVQTVAAMITGLFQSAFPEGRPASGSATEENETAPLSEGAQKEGYGTLIVVADTDFILDSYSIRRINFGGMQAANPLNDNLAFATNVVEFLAGSSDLISVRSKGSSVHPFTIVRDMEAIAQQRYQEQLTALETRLSSVQSELSNLQTQVGDNGLLVASPEIAEAITQYQAQEAEMRRERRDIRRALREDIDALETHLLLLNLFAAPAFVGVFGLWFHRARRR
ncbi:MAG: GldG family protein, partial [Opitutaceae bacterium]|nr:GldG family protein [Opitutaceae bacterium]